MFMTQRQFVRRSGTLAMGVLLMIFFVSTPVLADPGGENELGPQAQRFDEDGDGKLSPDERKRMQEERAKERLRRVDTDGDGKVSPAERKAAADANRAKRLKEADADGDGKISAAEREQARLKRLEGM